VVVIVVVDADVATASASWPVPDPIRKYVPAGMFGIPPEATVHDVVPAVAAEADAVAAAVPADQLEHAYRFWGAFASWMRLPGGSGRPVFGVHADSPTNRVWDGDSFFRMHTGFTPAPVGATNTTAGRGVVLAVGTGASFSRRCRAQMTLTTEPWPTYIVAVPALVMPHTDSVGPCKTICCPEGIARPVTAVTAVNDPT
jgi:hypothetical protein